MGGGRRTPASRRGSTAGRRSGSWQATPLPGPKADAYGCGDSFAAALAYGLGAGMALDDAIALGARCGAAVLCGRGPYGAMLGELSRRGDAPDSCKLAAQSAMSPSRCV